jgi:hypothetical protein
MTMTILKTLLLRAALALALACAATAPALAAPLYVTIDTASLSGQGGYLDFLFLGLDDAAPAEARVSALSGPFTGPGFAFGAASGSAGSGLVLRNDEAWNEIALSSRFGGLLRFAVDFDLAPGPATGTVLSVALLDANLNYLGAAGDVVRFSLLPGRDVDVYLDPAFATVGAQPLPVPEPASAWLVAGGLLLLAGRSRRRR